MATYSQFVKSEAAPRKVTWLCGPESVLVTEVIDRIITRTQPALCTRLYAGDTDEAGLWAQVCAYPGDDTRMIVVRNAQLLSDWHFLADAAEAAKAGGWVIFVSSDADLYVRQAGERVMLPGAAAARAAGGQLVRCAIAPGNHSERVAWVRRRFPADPEVSDTEAWEILARSGQRLSVVASVCAQAVAANLTPATAVKLLLSDLPAEETADLLVLSDRTGALAAAAELDPAGYGMVIGQLSGRLDLMAALHEAVQQGMGARDANKKLGIEQFLFAKFRTAAPDYSPDRVRARRLLLARMDAAYGAGARTGIPEALIAGW